MECDFRPRSWLIQVWERGGSGKSLLLRAAIPLFFLLLAKVLKTRGREEEWEHPGPSGQLQLRFQRAFHGCSNGLHRVPSPAACCSSMGDVPKAAGTSRNPSQGAGMSQGCLERREQERDWGRFGSQRWGCASLIALPTRSKRDVPPLGSLPALLSGKRCPPLHAVPSSQSSTRKNQYLTSKKSSCRWLFIATCPICILPQPWPREPDLWLN